jgi:hypothetical protein
LKTSKEVLAKKDEQETEVNSNGTSNWTICKAGKNDRDKGQQEKDQQEQKLSGGRVSF